MSEGVDPLAAFAEAARKGDVVATRRVLVAVGPAVLGVVRAVLGASDRDLEDVVQEALVGVVKGLVGFRGESTVMHFARSIALRRALDQRRARARRGVAVPVDDEEIIADGIGPDGDALASRRRAALRALFETLPEEQAEAFAQRVLLGASYEEIASQAGAPVETVRSRLRLAKAALRARIQGDPKLLELLEMADEDA